MPQITLTATSDSNGYRYTAQPNWNAARNGGSGNNATSSFIESANSGGVYENGRYFGFFDASLIPAGSKINSVIWRHPAIANNSNVDGVTMHIVSHTAVAPLDSSDYSTNGSTSLGSVTQSGLSTSATTDITLNATGIANFVAAITNKFGLITSLDLNNISPSINGGSQYTASVTGHQLIVDYTAPGGGILTLL